MKVLITGANGFLGYYLTRQLLEKGFIVIATGKDECRSPFNDHPGFNYATMDLTDPFAVHDVFENFKPEMIVHAGAMTQPDACELDQWQASRVNVEGTVTLLINAQEQKSSFVFVSTDFVFDGERGMYTEEDMVNPVNFYGQTKAEAEEAVKEYAYNWAIVRTVLVYGEPVPGGRNLLTIVREKLEKGEGYDVFTDLQRSPTYVEDLASGIISIIEKRAKGIYHLSGAEIMTPYEMACKTADYFGLDRSLIKPVTASDLPQPAKRPMKTGFVIDKAKKELGFSPVSFDVGLQMTFGKEVENS